MNETRILSWINVSALAAVIVVNTLANVLPIGGNTTGEVSAAYPTLFTPAPITFIIWGLIYLLMIVSVVYQTGIFSRKSRGPIMQGKLGLWFLASCALNIGWIFSWHTRLIGLSLIFIAGLLFCLIMINRKLDFGEDSSLAAKISIAGFQVYMGWIAAASIANLNVFLAQIQWLGFGLPAEFWTVASLLAGMVVGVVFAWIQEKPFATLAILWAYVGIFIRHVSPDGFQMAHPLIIATLIITIAVMVGILIVQQIAKRREKLLNRNSISDISFARTAPRS